MQITQEPFVRFTSFNFSVGGVEALFLIILGIGVIGSCKRYKLEAADIAIYLTVTCQKVATFGAISNPQFYDILMLVLYEYYIQMSEDLAKNIKNNLSTLTLTKHRQNNRFSACLFTKLQPLGAAIL